MVQYRLPFGGGAGAGVSINPVAFLVITNDNVRLMPVNHSSSIDKLMDYIPDLMERVNNMMNRCIQNKKEETEKIINTIKKNTNNENKKEEKPKVDVSNDMTVEYTYDEMDD